MTASENPVVPGEYLGTSSEADVTTPNAVLTWAVEAAGGTGEEGEWNVYFPDDGQTDHYAQVWAERECEPDVAIVALWTLDFGIEQRLDFKPHEARQLAAALLCAASAAEDRVAIWNEGNR